MVGASVVIVVEGNENGEHDNDRRPEIPEPDRQRNFRIANAPRGAPHQRTTALLPPSRGVTDGIRHTPSCTAKSPMLLAAISTFWVGPASPRPGPRSLRRAM